VDPAARIDTAPNVVKAVRPPRIDRNSPFIKRRAIPAWWILVSICVVAVTGLILLVCWILSQKREPGPTSAARRVLVVGKGLGENSFPTLQLALSQAGSGDIIEIHDNIEEFELSVSAKRNVTIQAAEGKTIVWKCPPNVDKRNKLLTLSSSDASRIDDFRLKGIILDGGGRLESLVSLYGYIPGLTLEDVTFKGYLQQGIEVAGCWGDATERRINFTRLTFQGKPATTNPILFTLLNPRNPIGAQNRRSENFTFTACDFGGAKVKIKEGALADDNLTLNDKISFR
jgi:hypothetical protein